MVDYSKWDRMDFSSSDDDDEGAQGPRVTRLDQPSRVSTDGEGNVVVTTAGTTATHDNHKDTTTTRATTISKSTEKNNDSISNKSFPPSNWIENGGVAMVGKCTVYWSQDRHDVVLRISWAVDVGDCDETKKNHYVTSKSIRLKWNNGSGGNNDGIVSYEHRNTAISTGTGPKLTIVSQEKGKKEELLLLQATIPHVIHYPQDTGSRNNDDDDDEAEIDWTIESLQDNEKYIIITLHKASPMEGVSRWWRRPFTCVKEEISPPQEANKGSTTTTTNSEQWKQVWDEAHAMFREKIARGEIPRNKSNEAS